MASVAVGAVISIVHAQPVAVSSRWLVRTAPGADGKISESVAVPSSDGKILIVVLAMGTSGNDPHLMLGNRPVSANLVGYDEVSRLGFMEPDKSVPPKPMLWRTEAPWQEGTILQAVTPEGTIACRGMGRVKEFGGKILPLALLKVKFERPAPLPGTPLLDSSGRVAALIFQAATGNIGYAVPAEAVLRVQQDVCSEGRLIRGRLGLTLKAETTVPRIVRVLPDSPAAAAGILTDDVLLEIGTRAIADYADAADAFFYLIPGRPLRVRIQRAGNPLDFTLTPVRTTP